MTEMERTELETAGFLRGEYALDEVAGKFYEWDCLKFRQGKRTILTICFLPDRYDFLIIFGKAEREKFERKREAFSPGMQEIYDGAKTYPDGKWMRIPVADRATLEEVKMLIRMKKNPNRKPLSTGNAVYGKCGRRCDLCVQYRELEEGFREALISHLTNVYGSADWSMRCVGCGVPGGQVGEQKGGESLQCLCAKAKQTCSGCEEVSCKSAVTGYRKLEHRSLSAEDVTWAVLPYLPTQPEKTDAESE